ncbi:MAG TPA: RHS repeat-associated core domain-containing protein [Ignavibacteria bacterium]|nr:RHS repeat-associated core domain-containing protein [Ignavibacteria bacterium]
MTTDALNNSTNIQYDHRNLITQIQKLNTTIEPIQNQLTLYRYDDAGNRIRKAIFDNTDPEALPIINIDNPSGGWNLIYEEYYVRGADGLELAIYKNNGSNYDLVQLNIFAGSDNVGKLSPINGHNYYIKDHLGSVRVVIDPDRQVISANDYDVWGYYLDNRGYEQSPDFDSPLYKFTSKERDRESGYDYFGARYYDSRIGRWGQVEPLLDKYVSFSPYCYGLNNPMVLKDVDGLDVIIVLSGYAPIDGGSEISEGDKTSFKSYDVVELLVNLENYVKDNNISDVDIKGYWSSAGDKSELSMAIDFINANLDNPNEKVYIYGYSQGGHNAIELSEMLKDLGVNVYNLYTVDAYNASGYSKNEIPANVKYNYNYYQLMPDEFNARGQLNKAKEGSKSKVSNKFYRNVKHGEMDKVTKEDVFRKIKGTLGSQN